MGRCYNTAPRGRVSHPLSSRPGPYDACPRCYRAVTIQRNRLRVCTDMRHLSVLTLCAVLLAGCANEHVADAGDTDDPKLVEALKGRWRSESAWVGPYSGGHGSQTVLLIRDNGVAVARSYTGGRHIGSTDYYYKATDSSITFGGRGVFSFTAGWRFDPNGKLRLSGRDIFDKPFDIVFTRQ